MVLVYAAIAWLAEQRIAAVRPVLLAGGRYYVVGFANAEDTNEVLLIARSTHDVITSENTLVPSKLSVGFGTAMCELLQWLV